MRCLITDIQVTAAFHSPQTLTGELLVHSALDVLIQELVADVYSLVIHPLVRLVGVEVC